MGDAPTSRGAVHFRWIPAPLASSSFLPKLCREVHGQAYQLVVQGKLRKHPKNCPKGTLAQAEAQQPLCLWYSTSLTSDMSNGSLAGYTVTKWQNLMFRSRTGHFVVLPFPVELAW